MAHRKTSKRTKARTMLRLADLEQSKNVFTRSAQPVRKNHMAMPSTNSSDGTVPNPAWHLTELSFFATGSFSNRRTLRPPPSMCVSPP
jgi:hypothetical protein